MKLAGFIVEQKNVVKFRKRFGFKIEEYVEWERFSNKIYRTQEIAEQAYRNCPYGGGESGYNMEGRIIPVYRDENESPITIKK